MIGMAKETPTPLWRRHPNPAAHRPFRASRPQLMGGPVRCAFAIESQGTLIAAVAAASGRSDRLVATGAGAMDLIEA